MAIIYEVKVLGRKVGAIGAHHVEERTLRIVTGGTSNPPDITMAGIRAAIEAEGIEHVRVVRVRQLPPEAHTGDS